MADKLQMMLKSVQQELKSIKEAQTRYEKEYIQKPSAAAAASSVSDSVERNQKRQLNSIRKAIEKMDDIVRKLEEDIWKNSRRIDDLEQYSRRNCLILHGCKIPAQKSYSEFESYVIHKLNSKLEISPAITTHKHMTLTHVMFFLPGKRVRITHQSLSRLYKDQFGMPYME